jgi:ribosomal protein S18 acetylase RimI-like enzyme
MIRRATVDDAAQLADLAARTFYEAFARDNRPEDMDAYMSIAYGKSIQRDELADPDLVTLVIEEDDALIAYTQLRLTLPEIEIGRFYVDGPWHGRGLAQSLMDAVFALGRDLSATRLWLGVWERNPRAIAFYEKCGFRDCGSHPFLVGSDLQTDRLMELHLGG